MLFGKNLIAREESRLKPSLRSVPNFLVLIVLGCLAAVFYFIELSFYDTLPFWIWPRGVWLLLALAGIFLIPIRALRLFGLFFLIIALSPLTILLKGDCVNIMGGCLETDVFVSGTYTFTDRAGKAVEVEIEGKSPFRFPVEALALEGEADVITEVSIEEDGNVVVTSMTSSASDMRSAFESATRSFFEGWQAKFTHNQSATFPLVKKFVLPFHIQDEDGTELEKDTDGKIFTERVFPLGSLIFNILILLVVALLVSIKTGNVLHRFPSCFVSVFSFLGVPYGLYLIACNFNFMIASGVTTNYTFLASTLMLGCSLILLSFFVDRIYSKTNVMRTEVSLGRERNIAATILLALGPLLDNSSMAISDVTNWFPASWEEYYDSLLYFWTWLENTFTLKALFFSSFLGLGYLLYRKGLFSLEGMYDGALIIGTVGIATAIILWFADMSLITQDYVYIFSSLSAASAALIVCSLAFCLFGLIVIQNPSLSLDRARKNLLLTELFAFFLFFAYAPISVSELGQSFEIEAEAEKREEKLVDRVKELEEKLGIVFEENEND